ncbi:hypothetical protein EJ06DRAFT_583029 [Trichodelitschia bisporula]|uniref:Survival Motor Neuron Gemin2-binding domain-containing protein n=1 Tax=Trichodelitschia bisporula TaxID=703511 RepID=A0A6G1HTI0_9PEZI|nr:hypothetical protein EJ06DRAFT_583029 [Trichodelitschia bisporula]
MAFSIDMGDRRAWDDSALIESWDSALAEYKKYHSIHAKGQSLEDVLTAEELEQLQAQREFVRTGGRSTNGREPDASTEGNFESSLEEAEEGELDDGASEAMALDGDSDDDLPQPAIGPDLPQTAQSTMTQQQPSATEPQPQNQSGGAGIPQAVQDPTLKNLVMSWYYAGYYSGLHDGQQQSSATTEPRPQSQLGGAEIPQELLGTVQDPAQKGLMMAWYHAGYYSGLYAGQQQGKK